MCSCDKNRAKHIDVCKTSNYYCHSNSILVMSSVSNFKLLTFQGRNLCTVSPSKLDAVYADHCWEFTCYHILKYVICCFASVVKHCLVSFHYSGVRSQFETQGICLVDIDLALSKIPAPMLSFFVCYSLWGLKLLVCVSGTSSSVAVASFAGLYTVCF